MKFKAILDANEEMQIISENDDRFDLYLEEKEGTFEDTKALIINDLEKEKEWIDEQLEHIGSLIFEDFVE